MQVPGAAPERLEGVLELDCGPVGGDQAFEHLRLGEPFDGIDRLGQRGGQDQRAELARGVAVLIGVDNLGNRRTACGDVILAPRLLAISSVRIFSCQTPVSIGPDRSTYGMIRRPTAVLRESMLRRWRTAVSRYCLTVWL